MRRLVSLIVVTLLTSVGAAGLWSAPSHAIDPTVDLVGRSIIGFQLPLRDSADYLEVVDYFGDYEFSGESPLVSGIQFTGYRVTDFDGGELFDLMTSSNSDMVRPTMVKPEANMTIYLADNPTGGVILLVGDRDGALASDA